MLIQAASSSSFSDSSSVIVWSCVLVVILVAGFMVIMKMKKRLRESDDAPDSAATGFTLSDLRQLHRSGQISDEELERAKVKIVAAARQAQRGGKNQTEWKPEQGPPE